jgi:hypothetical protein
MDSALIGVALGIGLGARHALEPDHLAAVSVLAADRPGARPGLMVGAWWGVGHTLSLLACGLAAAMAAARIPARVADLLEIAVAAMLIALGARAVFRGPANRHVHVHVAPRVPTMRPLIVGAVHGLAGSGALVALATAGLPTTAARVAFIALFGFGSIAAMSAISGLAGWPLARLARHPAAGRFLLGVAGATSVVVGVVWALVPLKRLLS